MQFMTTRAERIKELKREIGMRKQVYKRQVIEGRLEQEVMNHRLACFLDLLSEQEALLQVEDTQERLF